MGYQGVATPHTKLRPLSDSACTHAELHLLPVWHHPHTELRPLSYSSPHMLSSTHYLAPPKQILSSAHSLALVESFPDFCSYSGVNSPEEPPGTSRNLCYCLFSAPLRALSGFICWKGALVGTLLRSAFIQRLLFFSHL